MKAQIQVNGTRFSAEVKTWTEMTERRTATGMITMSKERFIEVCGGGQPPIGRPDPATSTDVHVRKCDGSVRQFSTFVQEFRYEPMGSLWTFSGRVRDMVDVGSFPLRESQPLSSYLDNG